MGVEELKQLSAEELRIKLNKPYTDARDLKSALVHYDVLSDNSLSIDEMRERTGLSKETIGEYRGRLIRHNLIKPKSKESKIKLGNIKKLNVQKIKGEKFYRFAYFNRDEMKAAGLNPETDYYCIVEPGDKKFTISMFGTREEAKEHKKNPRLQP
jgi:hypothetical protein